MSRPDDIPQDIWDASGRVNADIVNDEAADDRELVARAILAERKRCATAAEQRGKELGEPAGGSDIANTIRDAA